ncbi:unnamed protein product [Caenorhabditis auriculariae]|uniref:Serine/threonine-protein phosphatase n=1 Tax=Caenorhabditis auriculariae TaxID=2777116 RepID=A0A8S1GM93_9PELO|nr:unnamed protein product [Caenorhabditis auriculariae]
MEILKAPLAIAEAVAADDKDGAPIELQVDFSVPEVELICEKSKRAFLQADALLRINSEGSIIVVADLHGQVVHLLRIIRTCGFPPNQRYLFLGDYVDRGAQGVVAMILLLCLRLRYPRHVFLLRGNHEDVNTTLNYGFYDECLSRWRVDGDEVTHGEKAWRAFLSAFNSMPIAAVIGSRIFCAHGGISPFIRSLEDINKVTRPAIVPPYGIACDLLWSDPSPPGQFGWSLSHRGISFTYGSKAVEEFCNEHSLSCVIRGHQIFNEMYRYGYVLRCNGRLVSLFSALNYENYKNNACVAKVTFSSTCSIEMIIFRCRHYAHPKRKETMVYKEKSAYSQMRTEREKNSSSLKQNLATAKSKKSLRQKPSTSITRKGRK